jgi:NAD(P)H dehydrogenase (quinone)
LWTYDELAAVITEESGTRVVHRGPAPEEADAHAFLGSLVASGLFAEPSDDLDGLLSRPATGVRAMVRAALARS